MTLPTNPSPSADDTAPDDTAPNGRAPDDTAPQVRRPRRRPAPPAHPFFRFLFPLLVVVAGVAVVLLWREGAKAVLDTTDGTDVAAVDDPAAPGFLAFATPTPTLLVAHVDAADRLTGVTVLARTSLDDGGNLVVFSPDMLVELAGGGVILGPEYERGGGDALEAVLGEYLGFGFTEKEPTIMSEERLATFLALVEPIPYFLTDDLVRADADGVEEVVYGSGFAQFSGVELAEIFGWRNPSERDAGRFTRQLAIWEAWLARVGEADDLFAATLPFAEGLPPYLRALGTGTASLELAPANAVDFDPDNPFYALAPGNEDWPIEKGREMVPVPIGYTPGVWPTVQLLDGTGDADTRNAYLPAVVAAGAEIVVIGNALTFDVVETSVAYHDILDEDRAQALGDSLGVPVRFEEDLDQPAQLTVTVGADSDDLLARVRE